MSQPKYRSLQSEDGTVVDQISEDDGKTWRETETSAGDRELDREIAAKGGLDAGPDMPRGMGDIPVTSELQPGQFYPTPIQGGWGPEVREMERKRAMAVLPQVGTGEAVSRELGGDIGAGIGMRARAAQEGRANAARAQPGMLSDGLVDIFGVGARQRGRGMSPKSQELMTADDYLR